jgi:hypothetical protein
MASVSFRGKIVFEFDTAEEANDFVQFLHVGKEGRTPDDWPIKYDFGDYPFDTFKITDLKTSGTDVELSLDFTRENTTGMPTAGFVEATKEDFDTLAGIDTDHWSIVSAVAEQSQQGARRRRRRKTQKRKSASRKTRRRR